MNTPTSEKDAFNDSSQSDNRQRHERGSIRLDFLAVGILATWFFTPNIVAWLAGTGPKGAGEYGDMFGGLNALFSGMAFLGVLYNLMLQRQDNERQWQHRQSELNDTTSLFYLKSAVEAYERAIELLRDDNNERAIWIEAARVIDLAVSFGLLVTNDAHNHVLELNVLKARTFFYRHLQSQSPAFFYGTEDEDLDEAAKASSRERGVGSTSIPEEVIKTIWDAAQFPPEYTDSLGERFASDDVGSVEVLFPSVATYLAHRERNISFRGNLVSRSVESPRWTP